MRLSSATSSKRPIEFGLGFSCLFPSIVIANIGSSTGLQLSMVFAAIAAIKNFYIGGGASRPWLFTTSGLICIGFLCQLFLFSANDLLVKNFIAFQVCFICVYLGSLMVRQPPSVNSFVAGYIAGSLISSAFAIVQFVGWKVFNSSSSLLLGFRNSRGFGDLEAGSYTDFAAYGRSFGFTSEPSVLALLLLPAFVYATVNRKVLKSMVLGLGLVATQSITSIALLLPIFLYYWWKKGAHFLSLRLLTTIVLMAGLGVITFTVMPDFNVRLLDLDADGSTLSRLNSLASGWEAIQTHPLLGWGVQSDDLNSFIEDRSTIFELNKNIHSLLLSLVAWFGAPIAFIFLFPVVRFFAGHNCLCAPEISVFIAATIIPPFLSLNYFNLYNIWICFGFAAGYCFAKKGLTRSSVPKKVLN